MLPSRFFFALQVLTFIFLARPLLADLATVADQVDRMFEIGWSDSFEARARVDIEYDKSFKTAPTDPRVEFAYALIKMRQRQYIPASEAVNRVITLDEANLDAWQTRIWLAAILKKYEVVLNDTDRLTQLLADKERKFAVEERLAASRYAGRLFAYLEGPASGSINAALVVRQKATILNRLPANETQAFREAFDGVTAKFRELTADQENADEQGRAAAAREREAKLLDLADERERTDDRRDDLAERRDRIQCERQQQRSAIAKSDRDLINRIAQLERQAIVVERELSGIQQEITRLNVFLDREQDPVVRDQILRDIARLSNLARQYERDLILIQRQAAGVNAQRVDLNRQRFAADRSANSELVEIDDDLGNLTKRDRKVEIEEKRVRRSRPSSSRRARAIAAQATAFTTYEPYPLEQQKRRVLALFK